MHDRYMKQNKDTQLDSLDSHIELKRSTHTGNSHAIAAYSVNEIQTATK